MKFLVAAAVLAVAIVSAPAFAEPSAADAATARSLFNEGRKLMDAGKFKEACPKLEEGARLNPGIGMRFNLASCYEHLGKTASAWNLYLDVAGAAKIAKQPAREAEARKAAAKLEPKLSKLTVTVAARVPGLEIKRDGTPLGEGAVGTATAVDPGEHTIEATAPDHRPWSSTVTIGAVHDEQTVTVPKLVAENKPKPRPKPATPPPPPSPPPGLGAARTTALILGGAGTIGLGVGIFFGSRALSLNEQSDEHCDADNACDPDGFTLRNRARSWGNASSIAIIVGAVGIGAATVLWFSAPAPDRGKDKASIQTSIGIGPGGVMLRGVF